MISMCRILLYCLLLCVSMIQIVHANQCMQAIHKVSPKYKVPKDILTAVALTETGTKQGGKLAPYPWAINVEGKGFLFPSKAKAIAAVEKYLAEGKTSIDIGCMQLNWYWHGKKFGNSLHKAFDPLTNITVGAQYIREHFNTYKNWDRAVGRYHSGTAKFAQQYHKKFASNLRIAQANLGIITAIAPISIASMGGSRAYDDDRYNKKLTQKREYQFAFLNPANGSLIKFEKAESEKNPLIKLPDAPVPILDTERKRSLFQ